MSDSGRNLALDPTLNATYATRAKAKVALTRRAGSVYALPPVSTDTATGTFGGVNLAPISGGDSVRYPYNTTAVTRLGTMDVLFSQIGRNYYQNQCNGTTGSGAAPHVTEFDFYGSDFAVGFRAAVAFGTCIWVWADGKPLTAAPVLLPCTYGGDPHNYRITFTSGAAYRRIRIYMSGGDFGGIDCLATAVITPTPRPGLSIAVLGDSYVTGTGAYPLLDFATTIGMMLQADVYQCGIGGTGYLAGTTFGNSARINPLATILPDITLVCGSINDSSFSSAVVATAAQTTYASIRAAAPNTLLAVSGVQANYSPMSSSNIANAAAVKTAAIAAGAIVVTDPIGDGWITGTGHAPLDPPLVGPGSAAQSASSGGTFAAATYYYVVTGTNSSGETTRSAETSCAVVANGQITIGWIPSPTSTGSKVYRGTSAGNENALIYTGSGAQFTDTGAAGTAVTPPASNTSGNLVGDGKADSLVGGDGIHPSAAGHNHEARRLVGSLLTGMTV